MTRKPKTVAEKATKSTQEAILFSVDDARAWNVPPFQREIQPNAKVRALGEEIGADGGVIPGVLTFGVLDNTKYLIDGLQRREAFFLSKKPEGYADTRTIYCKTMAEMAREFYRLNSPLVRMRPDDLLRGLEAGLPALKRIREECAFVGYDRVRRSDRAPIISMSALLRSWEIAKRDVPTSSVSTAATVAEGLRDSDVEEIVSFLRCCDKAWGRDYDYQRLWGNLNLTLCAWLYRRIVLQPYSARSIRMEDGLFTKLMMSLSADPTYMDFLVGRMLGDRDRSPAYTRITEVCGRRVLKETGKPAVFPRPAWAGGSKRKPR